MKNKIILITFMLMCMYLSFNQVSAVTSASSGNRAPSITSSIGANEVTYTVKDVDKIKAIKIYHFSTKKWEQIKVSGNNITETFKLKEGKYVILATDGCKKPLSVKTKEVIKKSSKGKLSTNSSPKIVILNKAWGANYAYGGANSKLDSFFIFVKDGNGVKSLTITDAKGKKVDATIKRIATGLETLYYVKVPAGKGAIKYRIKVVDTSKDKNYRIEQIIFATKKYEKPATSSSKSSSSSSKSSSSSSKSSGSSSKSSSSSSKSSSSSSKSSKKTTSSSNSSKKKDKLIQRKLEHVSGKKYKIIYQYSLSGAKNKGTVNAIKSTGSKVLISSEEKGKTKTKIYRRKVTYKAKGKIVGNAFEKQTIKYTKTYGLLHIKNWKKTSDSGWLSSDVSWIYSITF